MLNSRIFIENKETEIIELKKDLLNKENIIISNNEQIAFYETQKAQIFKVAV